MCLQIILGVACLYRQVKTCHHTTCLTSTPNFYRLPHSSSGYKLAWLLQAVKGKAHY